MRQIDLKNRLTRLNLDDSYYHLGKEDYADALNVTTDAENQSQDIINTNITGNRYVPYNKPAGTNVTIGAKADVKRNRVFEFIWNSNDYHSIVIYDRTTDTRTKLIENLTDTNNEDVLQFTRENKIFHCDIIYRDESEGDLLFWTDGNVSPRKLNVKHIQDGIYTYIKVPFIELAKMPPINPVLAVYGNDAARNANSLRKKLVMATYRWSYDDFEKSTFTTYSKIPLPIGYYGSDNDILDTNNNFITFTVETGDENVIEIEIAARFNVNNDWDDFVMVISLNKEQLGIPDNSTYDYLFYNDGIYPPIPVEEVIQLFDWVPQKAESECLPNGNVVALGAITEGYDNYPVSELDVTITSENVANIPPDTNPPSITYITTGFGFNFIFTVNGSVPDGTYYLIEFNIYTGTDYFQFQAEYTAGAAETTTDVALALYNNIIAQHPSYGNGTSVNEFQLNLPVGSSVSYIYIQPGQPVSGIATEKTWLYDCNYIFGLGYKDEQGRLMPGVATYINPTNVSNDFMVTTPSFSLDGTTVKTPVITAEINHLPYAGSSSFAWVRRRMNYSDFLFYMTCDYQNDSGYLYFCLDNIQAYKTLNTQFVYSGAPITSESRIKIIAGITSGFYDGNIFTEDYEIIGVETRTLSGGVSPDNDKLFIKVKAPSSVPSYQVNMLVMVYTPMANPTDASGSVYYEWGEEYQYYTGYTINYSSLFLSFITGEIITGSVSGATAIIEGDLSNQLGISNLSGTFIIGETITGGSTGATAILDAISAGVLYHLGMTQNQTSFQPSIYTFIEGDVFFHERNMYYEITTPYPITPGNYTVSLMDAGFSDFFPSSVNDNGRGLVIEVNAKRTFFPATIRFSREYQQNTNINQTNRFLYNNFLDLDRSFGIIKRMSIRDRYIRIGQQFKIGSVPIFNQISKDQANSTLVAATDVLLNPVQYYLGDYGVGNGKGPWVDYNFSTYFIDTFRGIWCRLSRDGITDISVKNKVNSWMTEHGVIDRFIYGVFDPKSNNCIFSFEQTDSDPAATLSFNENRNSYESFLSYHPEWMVALGSLLITYKNGNCWTHDGTVFNNFYGIQYPSYISPVFNDQSAVKKKYLATGHKSLNNVKWISPTNGDIATSTVNPQTGLPQISQLKEGDYDLEEIVNCAGLLRDANSMADTRMAVVEGDYLGGSYIIIKLICPADKCKELVNISQPYVTWIPSGRNF